VRSMILGGCFRRGVRVGLSCFDGLCPRESRKLSVARVVGRKRDFYFLS